MKRSKLSRARNRKRREQLRREVFQFKGTVSSTVELSADELNYYERTERYRKLEHKGMCYGIVKCGRMKVV